MNPQMRKTVRFEELNTADLLAAGFDKVILPIGSCESHGDHLPFGIDAMIAHDLALAVAARVERTMVLPPIWYGMSHHYRHQSMEVSVSNDTNIRGLPRRAGLRHPLRLQEDPGDQRP
jgi:creatinine amidohydrolase